MKIPTSSQQEFKKIHFPIVADFVGNMTPCDKKIASCVADLFARHPILSYSHHTLAAMADCSYKTVERFFKKLKEWGYVYWNHRWKTSNVYFFNPIFRDAAFLSELTQRLRSFIFFSLTILLSTTTPKTATDSDVRRLKDSKELRSIYLSNGGIKSLYAGGGKHHQTPEKDIKPEKSTKRVVDDTPPHERSHGMESQKELVLSMIEEKLPLTMHGRINLLKYPVEALRYSLSLIGITTTKSDPYVYILGSCERFCKNNGLKVDRYKYDRQRELLSISPQDTQFVDQELLSGLLKPHQGTTTTNDSQTGQWIPSCRKIFVPDRVMTHDEQKNSLEGFFDIKIENKDARMFQDILKGTYP